ncbi:MAG: alpha-galactosidase [Ginsengibacter sp.]
MKKLKSLYFILLTFGLPLSLFAQKVESNYSFNGKEKVFTLSNDKVTQKVIVQNDILKADELIGNQDWLAQYHNKDHGVYTDGNFVLQMMWTDWSAPGKQFNGDLEENFTKKDYKYVNYDFADSKDGGKELNLYFTPFDHSNTVQLRITYQLLPGKFYSKRKLALQDTLLQKNWLQGFISRKGKIGNISSSAASNTMIRTESSSNYEQVNSTGNSQRPNFEIIKKGEFGQPCAIDFQNGGVFFGIEYPTATNKIKNDDNKLKLACHELIGKVVRKDWVESDWVVEGLAPDHFVKDWFFNYLPDVRVAANRPYTLYNSWYELRSPAFPNVEASHVMNEKNILNIIDLFKKNMIDKYGINLDAFVLDDGWDVYESDWKLNPKTFPHGVKPIVDALKPMGTTMGIWFGPTGGYSYRMKRINWMKEHGYETVGSTPNDEMMDIAGPKYSSLFEKRTTDLAKQGVGYFKWDGIQFSSSEPNSGHAVGYLSRRAAMESVIAKCKAVRAINPNEYLNITSGTWMSPWWLKYANQIWMQGQDYGYADVPSVNERDGAITYKDFVLYDDFHNQDLWFPVSNLMTHGVIKGNLERLGGKDDPLEKFANDAVFYFGRGVSMYEMYISPDLLNPQEWEVLSKSLAWAKNRFPILNKTYMEGGDPTKGETYAYVHFKNDSGIIAARNPIMQPQSITVKLDPAKGMADSAASLVLERTYPTHWISPNLYAAGTTITIPLQGYEAAIYEVYPLKDAKRPLLAGADFEVTKSEGNNYSLNLLDNGNEVKLLNPSFVSNIKVNNAATNINKIHLAATSIEEGYSDLKNDFDKDAVKTSVNLKPNIVSARYIVFLKPDSSFSGKDFPDFVMSMDGKNITPTVQKQNGSWATYSYEVNDAGNHSFELKVKGNDKAKDWKGEAKVWLNTQQKQTGKTIEITTGETIQQPPMPPSPYANGALMQNVFIGKGKLSL